MSTGAAPAPHLLLPQHAPHFQNAHASYEAPPPPAPWPRPQAPGQFLTEAGLRAPYPQGPPPQGPWGVVHGHSSFQMDSIARQDQSYARAAGTEWYPKPNVARPVLAAEHHQPGYQLPPINTFDLPTTQSNSSGSTGALPALDVWPTQHPPKDPLAPSLSAPLPIRAASAYVRELNPISQSLPSLPLKRAGIPTERDAASGSTSSLAKRPRIVDSFESQVSGRIQNTSVSNIIPHLDGPAAGWHRHGNVAEPRQPAQPDTRPPAPNSPINPSTEPNPQSWREWYSKYNNGAFVHRQNLATPPASTGRSTPGSDGRVEADHAAAARRQPSAPSPTSNHSMSPPRIEEPMPDSVSRAKGIKPDQLPDFVYQASQEVMKEAQMPDSFGLGFNGSRGKERGAKKVGVNMSLRKLGRD